MRHSIPRAAPTITFLSPHTAAADRVCRNIEQLSVFSVHKRRETLPKWGVTWDIHSLTCPETGTCIRCLASSRTSNSHASGPHSLIAVQDVPVEDSHAEHLLDSLSATKSQAKLLLSDWIRQPITPHSLLGSDLTPIIQLNQETGSMQDGSRHRTMLSTHGVLKEVVVPFFDASAVPLTRMASLPRLAMGLYQLSNGLAIRPLPASQEDHAVSPPSLIFHTSDDSLDFVQDSQTTMAKIGCSGVNRQGQTMLRHRDTQGLDIRFCPSLKPSSMFFEAQESLLASSLPELQSTNVLQPTGKVDPRTQQSDCWIEFRANLSKPMSLWKKTKPRIAKAPDLPFE